MFFISDFEFATIINITRIKNQKNSVCQSRFVVFFEQCFCLLNEVDSQINIYLFVSFVIVRILNKDNQFNASRLYFVQVSGKILKIKFLFGFWWTQSEFLTDIIAIKLINWKQSQTFRKIVSKWPMTSFTWFAWGPTLA